MSELIGYAYDFVSYLTSKSFWDKANIRQIILYGSVARGDAEKSSDIDMFVDTSEPKEALEKQIHNAEDLFYKSDRIKKWKLKGISNELSIIIGDLSGKAWDDLRDTISIYGITMWARFQAAPSGERQRSIIFSWSGEGATKQSQVNLCRRLYGYTVVGKHYQGALDKLGGKKLANGAVLVSAEYSNKIRKILRDLKMKYKAKEVFA